LTIVPDDVWVVVGRLQEFDFLRCETRKVGKQTFDSDGA
jgi:hypothetical protein